MTMPFHIDGDTTPKGLRRLVMPSAWHREVLLGRDEANLICRDDQYVQR